MVKNNQIISDDERKAIKELSELIDELNVTEIEIQNEKVGKVRVSKNKITPNHSNNTPAIKTSAPKDTTDFGIFIKPVATPASADSKKPTSSDDLLTLSLSLGDI